MTTTHQHTAAASPDAPSTNQAQVSPELRPRFWEAPLDTLNDAEWEALCDGCGRCCLHKYEDEDSGRIAWSCVACHLLDTASGHCSNYADRRRHVPDCLSIDVTLAQNANWLPPTCAYRLRAENRPLPDWHPLISGRAESVRDAGVSVAGRVVSELEALDVPPVHYVVAWPGQWPDEERRERARTSFDYCD